MGPGNSGSLNALILFEDEHLLVVRKPPGINTHAAGPFAGEGIYDWLRRREPRWAGLAIVQRLDKDTSGVLVFSKTRRGNVSLTKQFSRRRVAKEYSFLTDRPPPAEPMLVRSWIRKGAGRFLSLEEELGPECLEAQTRITPAGPAGEGRWLMRAEPLTGRTHQIRLHAADQRFPILGDTLYGGGPFPRLCLHARALRFRHPATNEPLEFVDEARFDEDPGWLLREAVVDPDLADTFRMIHGAADGHAGWYVDRLGAALLASSIDEVPSALPAWLLSLARRCGVGCIYVRRLDRHVRGAARGDASPRLAWGAPCPGEFEVRENGLRYRLSFEEGYSTGLFLDQRDNRRRLRVNWVGPSMPVCPGGMEGRTVLNVFAYTCAFSVAAAGAGAHTTSLDLSRKYLDWGRRNFEANGLDPAGHDFIYGDAFDWMRRLGRKQRRFDVVLLDPPTFSQSRERGVFRAELDYTALAELGASLLAAGGMLFASTNAARLEPERFLAMVRAGVKAAGRRVMSELYVPQPPDFPTTREEPAYLKTVWLRLD